MTSRRAVAGVLTVVLGAAPVPVAATSASAQVADEPDVVLDLGGTDEVRDVAVTADGEVVVTASVDGRLGVARLLRDGSLDPGFGSGGRLVTDLPLGRSGGAVAVQPDGRVVVGAGTSLVRLTPTGGLDESFGGDGVVEDADAAHDVVLSADGSIVTLGSLDLRRYSSAGDQLGAVDVNGGGSGYTHAAEQSSGHLLVTGASDLATAEVDRYTGDLTWPGPVPPVQAGTAAVGLLVLPDDRFLVVADQCSWVLCDRGPVPGIALQQHLADGTRDSSYSGDGVAVVALDGWPAPPAGSTSTSRGPLDAVRSTDGAVTVLGTGWLARFTAAGALDPAFGAWGVLPLSTPATELALDGDELVVAGTSGGDVVVRRVTPAPLPAGTAAARPVDESCPVELVGAHSFLDVSGNVHERSISCLVWWEVTRGRTVDQYAPTDGVSREAMASFVARAIGEGALPADPPDAFSDDNGSIHERAINQLAAAGVVSGTGGGAYAPGRLVTRGQMARFLANAVQHLSGALPSTPDFFADDTGHVFAADINRIAGAGITGGRTDRAYQPDATVSRDQMASFLVRLLDLLVEAGVRDRPAA